MSMDDDVDQELALLLADPSLWLEPGPVVEADVLDAIRAERTSQAVDAAVSNRSPQGTVVPMRSRRRAWSTQFAAGLVGAAAAALIAIVVVRSSDDDAESAVDPAASTFELSGTELAPGFSGTGEVEVQPSGTLIRMAVSGLPRREGGDFYEAWLKSCDGTQLVPIGTFHDMDRATGWAGVKVQDFPLLTVTAEQIAGPNDPEQGSSGQVVVTGAISPCPEG